MKLDLGVCFNDLQIYTHDRFFVNQKNGSSLFCVGKFKGSQIRWLDRNNFVIAGNQDGHEMYRYQPPQRPDSWQVLA